VVNGGKIESVKASGEAPGTLVEAKSLFFNLPWRAASFFFGGENTEASHVQHQLFSSGDRSPETLDFVFVRDQSVVFQTPAERSFGRSN